MNQNIHYQFPLKISKNTVKSPQIIDIDVFLPYCSQGASSREIKQRN